MKYQLTTNRLWQIDHLRSAKKQSGLATVLIVLLVGVSMTVIAMGLAKSVKSTQYQQVAAHATTNSQSAAWAAVQIFKQYLQQLDYDNIELIQTDTKIPITLAGGSQILSATVVAIDTSLKATDGIRVTTNIKASDENAQASSVIQVVYLVANTVCDICQILEGHLDLFDNTFLGGDIKIEKPASVKSTVNVDGDVNAINISLDGVTYLNATGDITLGSAVPVEEVYTNGDLILDGSANVAKGSALGRAILKNNGSAGLIYANGDLEFNGGIVGIANTLGDATLTNYVAHGSIYANGSVAVFSPVQKVRARGNITLNQWAPATDIATQGNLTCPSAYWNLFGSLAAQSTLINCPAPSANVKQGVAVEVPIMDLLPPFVRVKPKIDVWAIKAEANYQFEFIAGKIKVTVKNVNSIGDGTYFLGTYPFSGGRGHYDYLCDAVDASGNCTSPATLTKTICQGQSTSNACFSYDSASQTWTIDSKNIAPGVAWFEGNLNLSNGQYYNTFAATGDITTAGGMKTYAPNYIGYNAICSVTFPLNTTTDFANMYPTQLCDLGSGQLAYAAIGNVTLMAGGYNPSAGGVYQGGNITLSASNELFGTVLAGSYFDTAGDTIVHGYIAATANKGGGTNDLGGKVVINLNNLPATYNPNEVPLFDGDTCQSSCAPPAESILVLWSRYL
jgi:hypothetical protein